MSKTERESIASVTQKIFDLIQPLESDERTRAIAAALTLLGESLGAVTTPALGTTPTPGAPARPAMTPSLSNDPKSYFEEKKPTNKGEELAVAAKFVEDSLRAEAVTKDLREATIKNARRNFDGPHFWRDLTNAKTKGLFNKGKDIQLSYYGQQYVDTLPDRDALKNLPKPRRGAGKRPPGRRHLGKKSS